jgi:hypothetical protein
MPRNPDPLKLKTKPKKPARPGHGGTREGSGRPPAAATRRSKQVADEIAEGKRFIEEHDGVPLPADATPLDVMLLAMRRAYVLGGSLMAAPYAEKAAPYIHARIAQMELKNPDDGKPFRLLFQWAGDTTD